LGLSPAHVIGLTNTNSMWGRRHN